MKQKITEIVKDIIIVILLCAIILLTLMALPTNLVSRLPLPPKFLAFLGAEAEDTFVLPETNTICAAQPLVISCRNPEGRQTVQRNFDALDSSFSGVQVFFAAALSSMEKEKAASREDLVRAASNPGILLDYGSSLPLSELCRWLGISAPDRREPVRKLLLSEENNAVSLYLIGTQSVCVSTQIPVQNFREFLNTRTPDGSKLLFEENPETELDPLTVFDEQVTAPDLTAENPFSAQFAANAATALNFNPYGAGAYESPDGDRVFTELGRTCTVSADGVVSVSAEGGMMPVAKEARAETARSLLASVHALAPGYARLYLRSCEEDGESAVYTFGYVVDGVPVWEDAAKVSFDRQGLTQLRFAMQIYRKTTETLTCLPLRQAAAIMPSGATPFVGYKIDEQDGCTLRWKV